MFYPGRPSLEQLNDVVLSAGDSYRQDKCRTTRLMGGLSHSSLLFGVLLEAHDSVRILESITTQHHSLCLGCRLLIKVLGTYS